MKKRIVSMVLALAMILSLSVNVFAAAPVIEDVEYEGRGLVEVEFKKDVRYKNVKVTVKNAAGTKMTAKIVDKDEDDLTFFVKNLKPGAKYRVSLFAQELHTPEPISGKRIDAKLAEAVIE